MTSYAKFNVSVFNSDKTPKEIGEVIRNALPDDEVEVFVNEHSGECKPEFCGELDW